MSFDLTANSGMMTLVSEAVVPLYEQGEWKPDGSWVSYYHEDIPVPAGEFDIDFEVTGLIRYRHSGTHEIVTEFGPGGATYPRTSAWVFPGEGAVGINWHNSSGRLVGSIWPGEADRGPSPSFQRRIRVRGPGVLRLGRVRMSVGWGTYRYVEGEQFFSVRATPVSQAAIQLSCTGDLGQNRVTRGKELVCTAQKNPSSAAGTLTVTQWSFDGAPRDDADLQSLEWRGIMVRSGTVQVKGKVGSGTEQTATATIQVSDRAWPDAPVMHMLELGATGGEDRVPPLASNIGWASDLGAFRAFSEPPPGEQVDDPITAVQGGPNDGLYYFSDLSFPVWGRIRINDVAMQNGSPFYDAQERQSAGGGSQIGGQRWCSNRVVSSVLPELVRAHEQRHAEVYRQSFGDVLRTVLPELERLTGTYTQLADAYEPVRPEAHAKAYAASWAIHDLSGNPNVVTPSEGGRPCNLKNEAGRLLANPPKEEIDA